MSERSRAMATSVARIARSRGLTPAAVDLLGKAHEVAMRPRLDALDDDHHPAYLHPGRAALILLRDVGPLPAEVIAAAMVHETVDEDLRVPHEEVRGEVSEGVAEIVEGLPLPGDERLLERLVTLEEGPLLAALAERLDQIRHAHMREDRDDAWRSRIHEEVGSVWGPVAERAHPRLADRFRHWHEAIGRRLG